jgi:HlyD family secretion protein
VVLVAPVPAAERAHTVRLRPHNQRRWLVWSIVVVLLTALVAVLASGRTSAPSYRTASVERADVDATLDSLGTIQPINQANLSFPVAGDVGSVSVAVGQQVTVGQTLAQLDTTALDSQVASAQSAVAAAQARLASDQSSQTSGPTPAAVAPAAFITGITGPPDPTAAARDLVTTQQAHLIADQHRADQDLATEQHDLKTETGVCQSLLSEAAAGAAHTSPTPGRHNLLSPGLWGTAPVPAEKSASAAPLAAAGTPTPLDAGGCESALQTVLADQVAVEHDQQAVVSTDMPALNSAVDKLLASTRTSAQPQPYQTPRPALNTTIGSPAGGSPASGSPAGGASRAVRATGSPAPAAARAASPRQPASAEQLASDQAAIDAAKAQLAEAQQSHDQAQLRSPIDGTVGSMTISAGQSVQGNSGTPQIVVIGPGSHQVSTSVSDTNVTAVQVGDAATVTPSGSSAPLSGQVVSVGLLASSGTSGSAGYPVTIGLTGNDQQLFAGQSASVSIMLAHVSSALTVPSSAVHTVGANHSVTVLRNGTASNVRVTVGAIGPTRTQVLSGLNPGDQVVLAELSQPLPTTNIQNLRRAAGGGGGGGRTGG